jgi:hypothetical protein
MPDAIPEALSYLHDMCQDSDDLVQYHVVADEVRRAAKLETALKDIVRHHEIINGQAGLGRELSATIRIAENALGAPRV